MTTLTRRRFHWSLWAVPLGLLLAGGATHVVLMLLPAPADLDLARTQTSAGGSFVATVAPGDLAIDRQMTWQFDIKDAQGAPIAASALRVDGGMPLHGHGLPSQPSAPQSLGGTLYEVGGIRFSMPGWWVVKVHRATPDGDDIAEFNFLM
ncbi:hypothetical protein VW23_006395 [Devosia insulae DS-56]|uniref:YtkA-like domain-containing protein n=2 Tax=Devosia insulae TaxID=408174 RepID=A0A1E5XHK4_9HYPH|nr:hypothetical protein VW23_006395 [Devosia insulae DS-56]